MTLLERFLSAVAMLQGAAANPVRAYVIALFVQDQGPRVGLVPKPNLLRNLQPLGPSQQQFAGALLQNAHDMMRGPIDQPLEKELPQ